MRTLTRAGQLAGQHGKKVRLVGVCHRWLEEDKKGRESRFTGLAVVELAGAESVQIGDGPRPMEEVERCDGQRVAVVGVLDTSTPRDRAEEARPDPLPILRRPGTVEPTRG